MPRKVFTAGEILTAANLNDVSDATVMVFDNAAARTTAIPTPSEGMVTYLKDTDRLEQFDGTNFVVAAPPQTGVLQVVSTIKTDTFTSSSNTFVDITGLTVSITPSATSSKILVFMSVSMGSTSDVQRGLRFMRDSTPIAVGASAGSRRQTGMWHYFGGSNNAFHLNTSTLQFLDSPATTSALTYKVQGVSNATGTFTINRNGNDSDSDQTPRSVSTITVMEVAG